MRGYFDAFSDVVDDQVHYFRSGERAHDSDSHVRCMHLVQKLAVQHLVLVSCVQRSAM